MNPEPYILSFTGASLCIRESVKIAEVYLELKNWPAVKEEVKSANLLQARTRSSVQRLYQELQPRLEQLSTDQIELLVEGTPREQKQLLWFAICRRYTYIQEFAIEVIREKFLRLDFQLTGYDYDSFYHRKADWRPELDALTDSSRQKMKTRLFRMLVEAEITSPDQRIQPATLSLRLRDALAPAAPLSFQVFPLAQI